MHDVIREDGNKIEVDLSGEVDSDEFLDVVRRLESMCEVHSNIRVLLNAADLRRYDFKVILEEHDFYKKYSRHLERVAIISDRAFETFALRLLGRFVDTDVRGFPVSRAGEARDWIWR